MDKSADLLAVVEGDLEALIRYAHVVSGPEALTVARRLIGDGTWVEAANEFRGLLDNKLQPLPEWPGFAFEVFEVVVEDHRQAGEVRPAMQELVEMLGRRGTDEVRRRVVRWFVEVAGPGEAQLALRLVRSGFQRPDGHEHASLERWCLPLVTWLVDRGPGELVRGTNPFVLLHIIETCRTTFPGHLIGALKVLGHSDRPEQVFTVDAAGDRILHPAIEAALEQGLPEEWVDEVLGGAHAALTALGYARFFAPFDPARGLKRFRKALLGALARGRWQSGLGTEIWMHAFKFAAVEALVFTDDGLEVALRALADAQFRPDVDDATLTAWTEVIATAWFERFGLSHPQLGFVPGIWPLDVLAIHPRLASGIARALARALAAKPGDEPALARARAVMARVSDDPRHASVALLLLPRGPHDDPAADESLDEVYEVLRSIVRADWSSPVAGVDVKQLFRGASDVRITERGELRSGVLIDFAGDVVLTGDRTEYRRILRNVRRIGSHEDALAVCASYFVHEVIHVLQGLQRKTRVDALRSNGSEHTLAHFDLEADDLAERIVASATPWSLGYMKNIAGKGALTFPASMHHTNASVARKSVRLVSLRLDHLLRERGTRDFGPDTEGFVAVDVPYGAGSLLVTWYGPSYTRLFAIIKIEAPESALLTNLALRPGSLLELDAKLVDLLDRADFNVSD